MTFLNNIISELLKSDNDLSKTALVLPGKRPVVFIKRILAEKKYSGFLPDFYTVEELVQQIAGRQELKGIALWLFAYDVYRKSNGDEDFSGFLKWFPTLQKDWDDMLKFSEGDKAILEYMLDEERIKNWGESLGDEDSPRRRNLNFWRKMNTFLPELKKELSARNWATSGMIHEEAKGKIEEFVAGTDRHWVFCGFNAFTPVEEKLVRTLLKWDKAECFFQADAYYMNDKRQEAGKFLREHQQWKEFNEYRPFRWTENKFSEPKDIKVFEVSGNITQTKILPEIFAEIPENEFSDTAVVLLDENLLPAALDALSSRDALNITMGFPLKNLAFSNAMKKLFYIQKQQEKKSGSYYYSDVLAVVESLPKSFNDQEIIEHFTQHIQEHNIVYISRKRLQELLGGLSYFKLFEKPISAKSFLETLITYCERIKFEQDDKILFENIAHFEKSFRIIRNQIEDYDFEIKMDTLEVLINQLVNSETIDFQGEPLQGLQIMGLLETRLLNFKNIILLSVNEGKLPLGNTQNTYLPFDVRKHFNLHTFLENDSIYAYHFYRLLQGAEKIVLMYNALSSGVNTGEKSRFITQIEMESGHETKEIIIENSSEPVEDRPMVFEKTEAVLQRLEEWKNKVSASHLTSYLYNPVQFYFNYVLKARESDEIEEELSQRNYGNIVHYALEELYSNNLNKSLSENDLHILIESIPEAVDKAIERLKHQPEFYQRGMNFIHKSIASNVIQKILTHDLKLIQNSHTLEIIDLERKIEDVPFKIDDENSVNFYGFIDRIDRLDGKLRVIDYKTGKSKKLNLLFKEKTDNLLIHDDYKQALQLCIYLYYIRTKSEFSGEEVKAGIWSFAEASAGVKPLNFEDGNLDTAMNSVRNLILEILDPSIPFEEKQHFFVN